MYKSPFFMWLGMISWFVTAIASIGVGLAPMGYNLLHAIFGSALAAPVAYVIGICGIISLIMFAMHGFSGDHCCKP